MDIIKQEISEQLINSGYTDFEFVRIDEIPAAPDGNGDPFYEKTRLLIIFNNRLKGCLLYDPENEMIDYLKSSIAILESIPDESSIYYWQIKVNGGQVSGRSTEKQILHIFPTSQETSL